MSTLTHCPACGTSWQQGQTCQDHFYQLLYWEAEYPAYAFEVHHLMVLSYHLQHPHLMSVEGLQGQKNLLVQFVVQGVSPVDLREEVNHRNDSGKRTYKITARPDNLGKYNHPIQWTMTAADVVAQGVHNYVASTQRWAAAIHADLVRTNNLT